MEAPAGVLCALVTPFNADGTPDLGALAELVEFQVQGGAAGLFVLGTTGEGVLLDASERRQLAERLAALDRAARAGRLEEARRLQLTLTRLQQCLARPYIAAVKHLVARGGLPGGPAAHPSPT
jgi:dihydrodipicolinate synthase/N-acetylneuraminate lyase